ncbi:hypothetical protein [Streptomyces beihaiensis]|uniref:MmpS family membrane protein n=1 Tax=Streptomyces beihaiensis TaxID=2984495 RepID=A0ABT3U6E6_9ACTN|nr:hypothetical protein [Streptomyces beihaiensis]MCX3064246.1 hypothetical protein [Streptomyces beihaiensis]
MVEKSSTEVAQEPAQAPKDPAKDPAKDSAAGSAKGAGRLRRPDRAGFIAAGVVLAACAGLVLYGVLNTSGNSDEKASHRAAPTAPVTYDVTGTGTADLTYQAHNETGKATVIHNAHLPWHTTVHVPLGQQPLISIVLGPHGGTAHCALAIRGHHVQSSTATGTYGRATCSGALPATDKQQQG